MSKTNDYCHFYCYLRKAENCIIHEKYEKEEAKYKGKSLKRQNSDTIWHVDSVNELGFILSRNSKGEHISYELDWDRFRKHWKVVS